MELQTFVAIREVCILIESKVYKTSEGIDSVSCKGCQLDSYCSIHRDVIKTCIRIFKMRGRSLRFDRIDNSLLLPKWMNRYIKDGRKDFINTTV